MTRTAVRHIRLEGQTSRHAVRDMLDVGIARLADWQISQASIGNIQIVLGEVLNNVVEHAYDFRDGGFFSLEMTLDGSELTCVVTDQGTHFPDGTLPTGDPVAVDGPIDALPEGGFGWFMIRELTDSLTYERTNETNTLTFLFKVV